jgi:hypothetical protein
LKEVIEKAPSGNEPEVTAVPTPASRDQDIPSAVRSGRPTNGIVRVRASPGTEGVIDVLDWTSVTDVACPNGVSRQTLTPGFAAVPRAARPHWPTRARSPRWGPRTINTQPAQEGFNPVRPES